jgi:hypothetical protein
MTRRLTATVLASICLTAAVAHADVPDAGSSFSDVWAQVASDPYKRLPHEVVTLGSFYGFLQNKVLESARRTLSNHSDLLPRFQKLLHPNGICLAGTWNITADTHYTGLFKKDSHAFIIARASTALTNTTRGDYRAFGFAGKLFPTTDPHGVVETANFFTVEDLGGTLRDHFLDALNTNDIINITPTSSLFFNSAVGVAVVQALTTADHTLDLGQVLIRQLYPVAEAGEADPSQANAPQWITITGASDVPRVDAADFRDELRLANYPAGLRFEIWVADQGTRRGAKSWEKIGYIEVVADALTDSCDHRLHFSHPTFRP